MHCKPLPHCGTLSAPLTLLLACGLAGSPGAQAASYSLLDLAPPAAYSSGYSHGNALNNAGDVVGYVNSASFPVAATWLGAASGDTAVRRVGAVSAMPGGRHAITAINDIGVMVGGYDGASGPVPMFNNGQGWRALPWPDTRYTCCGQVDDINNAGVAVGGWYPTGLSSPTRFTPDGRGGYGADSLGGGLGGAVAINEAGQIAGTVLANGNSGPAQAVLWQPDKSLTRLGALDAGHNTSQATALNAQATVVGWSTAASGLRQGFVWSAGVMTALPALPGAVPGAGGVWLSNPQAINDAGTVVGHALSANGQQHGFVMLAGGAPLDLNTLVAADDPFFSLPGVAANHDFTIIDAVDINQPGQILAVATYRSVGAANVQSIVTQGFLLTPLAAAVPEPGTWALLALGLGVLLRRQRPARG